MDKATLKNKFNTFAKNHGDRLALLGGVGVTAITINLTLNGIVPPIAAWGAFGATMVGTNLVAKYLNKLEAKEEAEAKSAQKLTI